MLGLLGPSALQPILPIVVVTLLRGAMRTAERQVDAGDELGRHRADADPVGRALAVLAADDAGAGGGIADRLRQGQRGLAVR